MKLMKKFAYLEVPRINANERTTAQLPRKWLKPKLVEMLKKQKKMNINNQMNKEIKGTVLNWIEFLKTKRKTIKTHAEIIKMSQINIITPTND